MALKILFATKLSEHAQVVFGRSVMSRPSAFNAPYLSHVIASGTGSSGAETGASSVAPWKSKRSYTEIDETKR